MAIDWTAGNLPFLRKQLERGQVILFAGAGFSFDARNEANARPPLGADLAKMLADRASMPFNGESLPVVYDAAQKHLGSQSLWSFLKELYVIQTYPDWYSIVASIAWNRIYTTNIDNLLQLLYQRGATQRLETIVCPSPPQERDPHFRRVQGVHLHGHVDHPQNGLTFTLTEFAKQTGKPNPWYQALADDLYRQSVLFVGTYLEEPPFHHYLEMRDYRDRAATEYRPKSFLVSPHIGTIRATSLKDRNIQPIECTGEKFFTSLSAHVPLADLNWNAVCKRVYPHVIVCDTLTDADTSVTRYFDLILPNALPPLARTDASYFFLGAEPTWDDIEKHRDGVRVINQDFLGILKQTQTSFRCIVLHGPAGCGKTTTLMRTACDVATEGNRVFYAKGFERLNLEGILRLARGKEHVREPLFVFIDVMARHLGSINQVRSQLSECKNLTLILAERSNAYYSRCQAIADLNPIEIKMPDLVEEDVVAILERLKHFGYLGVLREKSQQEQLDAFMERASRQLLVAMREATSGKGFDAILHSEFGELPPAAKLAYTICSLAVSAGAAGVYRQHLSPCLPESEFRKGVIINDLLRGIIIPANETGTMLKPRHRLIAKWVATEVSPHGLRQEATSAFLKQIASSIVPNEIKRRSPAYIAYRGMINSEGLYETFNGNMDMILGLYAELYPYYNHDFLFWLQRGMVPCPCGGTGCCRKLPEPVAQPLPQQPPNPTSPGHHLSHAGRQIPECNYRTGKS
jgi:hypothetical protein